MFKLWIHFPSPYSSCVTRPLAESDSVSLSVMSVTPQTVAHQAPLSMGFSRQVHWSGFPFPSQDALDGTEFIDSSVDIITW